LDSGATIEFPKLPKLKAHKTGMLQLFQNLLANAIKFRADEPPRVIIQCDEVQESWQFTISDNGLGLDESFQEKAFLPFQRVNYLDRPGTGMGLAICKKIVKVHKGDIWFKSALGQGTTFYFTIAKDVLQIGD
jgi:two-component system, chemotaxis family, sensor kinase Cph1